MHSQERALEAPHAPEDELTPPQRQVAKGRGDVAPGARAVYVLHARLELPDAQSTRGIVVPESSERSLTVKIR
jgi:hypothetical protein